MLKRFFKIGSIFFMATLALPPLGRADLLKNKVINASTALPSTNTLKLGWYGKPAPLDPLNTTDTISIQLFDLIFSRLVRYGSQGEFTSDVATYWEVSEDELTYTFYLRDDVYFHDGKKLSSEDFEYTFNLMRDPVKSPVYAESFSVIEKVEALSRDTLQIKLKSTYPSFMILVWKCMALPRHLLDVGGKSYEEFILNPIGSGPFKFESRTANGGFRFIANKDYYEDIPKIDFVDILTYESKEHVWTAFLRHDIDMLFYLSRENYKLIKFDPSFNIYRTPSTSGYALYFNMQDPVLGNKKIRKAFFSAINRDEIVKNVEDGEGLIIDGPFFPFGWVKDKERSQYQPEKALGLLEEARRANIISDVPIQLEMMVHKRDSNMMKIAKLLRQQLQEVGIQLKITPYSDADEFRFNLYQQGKNYQVFLGSYNATPEADFVLQYWSSKAMKTHNISRYDSDDFDELVASLSEDASEEMKLQTYQQVYELMHEDLPFVPLYYPYNLFATSEKIKVSEDFFIFFSLIKIKDVFISTEERR